MSESTDMADSPEAKPPNPQFRLRTLLLIMTAACVLLGFTLAVLPPSVPDHIVVIVFAMLAAVVASGARMVHQSIHHPWKPSENTVTVQIDSKWLRRIKSPLIMMPVASLTGVSLTFAPAYLLWCGPIAELGILEWIGVIACFLMMYSVPSFYMSLAGEVIAQLVRLEDSRIETRQD